ncbi:hypothetical protein BS78_07G035200 [Paspalum vaginatum]|nr:hypothetical protein BS78_07G035200 [Paspalum vaginatum]
MENLGEDHSSTANQSFSDDGGDGGGAAASEESGWTSYIDYFMETQHGQAVETSTAADPSTDDVGRRCRSTSEYSVDCGAGGSTQLPALVEPSAVSRRLRLKEDWMRKKKVLYDESLEDTATSPISSPKLIELRDSDATQQKENSCDVIWHSKKSTTGDVKGVNTATGTAIKEEDGDAYDNNELRKKGLCRVPVSAFHV